jgi:hypothetical protein
MEYIDLRNKDEMALVSYATRVEVLASYIKARNNYRKYLLEEYKGYQDYFYVGNFVGVQLDEWERVNPAPKFMPGGWLVTSYYEQARKHR